MSPLCEHFVNEYTQGQYAFLCFEGVDLERNFPVFECKKFKFNRRKEDGKKKERT